MQSMSVFGRMLLAAVFLLACTHYAVAGSAVTLERHMLGDTPVFLEITRYGGAADLTVLVIHENETTAAAVAHAVLAETGGRVIELKHQGTRDVSFKLAGKTYKFDPNRIFTSHGLMRTLGGNVGPEPYQTVRKLANAILYHVKQDHPVIALHNNTNGRYSLKSYLPGGVEAVSARNIHDAGRDADHFFLVTDANWYNGISQGGLNVVLQADRPIDDGSLSVYCAAHRIPYINIETQHGAAAEQTMMLRALIGALG